MGVYLNPAAKGFEFSLNSPIYVDKSGLISKTNARINTQQRYMCVSRPRRFGKSMAADMLAAYYAYGQDNHPMFQGLEISGDSSYETHRNRYNVLKINMQYFLSSTDSMDAMLAKLKKYLLFDLLGECASVRFCDEADLVQVEILLSRGNYAVF